MSDPNGCVHSFIACDRCGEDRSDAFDALRQRAEYAESRLASISGVTRQALVERAVRETIEECLVADGYHATSTIHFRDAIRALDPAPIVARVLGGGE